MRAELHRRLLSACVIDEGNATRKLSDTQTANRSRPGSVMRKMLIDALGAGRDNPGPEGCSCACMDLDGYGILKLLLTVRD